jgi:hypothetical protein
MTTGSGEVLSPVPYSVQKFLAGHHQPFQEKMKRAWCVRLEDLIQEGLSVYDAVV